MVRSAFCFLVATSVYPFLSLGQTAPPPCISLLAMGTNVDVHALAEVLTSELSPDNRFLLLERAQVDKALAEQSLSAAGLTAADRRVAIGRVLQADGICLLVPHGRKDRLLVPHGRKDRLLVSLSETRCGFQVCSLQYRPASREDVAPESGPPPRSGNSLTAGWGRGHILPWRGPV